GLRLHTLDREWFRPGPLIAFFLSKAIRLDDVEIVDSPCWTTHFRCCDGVEIRNVSIRNDRTVANSDGFSIDCSRNVLVSGCTVVTGDDAVAIRASCKLHATEHPCEHVVIEDCNFTTCCIGVRVGVGTGTIRDVAIRRVRCPEATIGIAFTPAWLPGTKGCRIENVRVEDCDVAECDRPVFTNCVADDWRIRDVLFERCTFESLRPSIFRGDSARHPENIVFRDCSRRHLDKLKVRFHTGFCGERSRKFAEIAGEDDIRLENCISNDNADGTHLLPQDDRHFA
ncbi:MAG: right-handed parallel beta-helix repeat-containing protein, partial [Kiritimatiellae bacterium]|nr:right-handed parallel beta-helix repeat-containing protein [Kiritimatiellia bacterium]